MSLLSSLAQDVWYDFRLNRRQAILSAAIVLTLELGIGANTAIFSFSAKFGLMGDATMAMGAAVGSSVLMFVPMIAARRVSGVTLLILGLMLGFLCLGLVSVVLHFTDEMQANVFEYWNDGSFGGATSSQLLVLAPVVALGIGIAGAFGQMAKRATSWRSLRRNHGDFGETCLCSGVFIHGILAGVVTAYSGPVAFLGLVVANLSRGLFCTSDHKILIAASVLRDALIALLTDLITHLPWSKHFLHLNAVEGLVGTPIVIWIILRGGQPSPGALINEFAYLESA